MYPVSIRARALVVSLSVIAMIAPAVPLALRADAASATPFIPLRWATQLGQIHQSSPAVADINGDGVNDVVVGSRNGYLNVLDQNGNALGHWPQPVLVYPGGDPHKGAGVPTAVDSSPTVADLDGNGQKEIIVGAGSNDVPNQQGGLVVFNADGNVRCRFHTQDTFNVWNAAAGAQPDGYDEPVFSTPAVGDINGDGHPDIVFGSWDSRIYAIDSHCNLLPGFLTSNYDYELNRWSANYNDDTVWSSPALYDVNGDGRLDILIGGDSSPGGPTDWAGGIFRALTWRDGHVYEIWNRRIGEQIQGSPAVGDIDGDGRAEVVVSTAPDGYNSPDASRIWAWHAGDGSDVPGWPQATVGHTVGSPAIGDVDGNGSPEVVATSQPGCAGCDGEVYVWHGNGALMWHRAPQDSTFHEGGGDLVSSPMLADLDGNGQNDIVVGNGWGTFFLRGSNGAQLYRSVYLATSQNSAAFGQFGNQWDVITAALDGSVRSLQVPTPGTEAPWPMFRKSARRIGAPLSGTDLFGPGQCRADTNPKTFPDPVSTRGYWMLGNDGGVFTFGSAQFYGSLPGLNIQNQSLSINATRSGNGYWVLGKDGGVFSFGDAQFRGSVPGLHLGVPIEVVDMKRTPSGNGYWVLGKDGGIFTFGDAQFFGSVPGLHLPVGVQVKKLQPTVSGRGYWILGSDGGIFSFGDATFHGSVPGLNLGVPVTAQSLAADPQGRGYWVLGTDGGVFSFGVPYYGSIPGTGTCTPLFANQITATSNGYYVTSYVGAIYSFGNAPYYGGYPFLPLSRAAVDLTIKT
jgi:hypothetical protein